MTDELGEAGGGDGCQVNKGTTHTIRIFLQAFDNMRLDILVGILNCGIWSLWTFGELPNQMFVCLFLGLFVFHQ